jgi:hypothetical protein
MRARPDLVNNTVLRPAWRFAWDKQIKDIGGIREIGWPKPPVDSAAVYGA